MPILISSKESWIGQPSMNSAAKPEGLRWIAHYQSRIQIVDIFEATVILVRFPVPVGLSWVQVFINIQMALISPIAGDFTLPCPSQESEFGTDLRYSNSRLKVPFCRGLLRRDFAPPTSFGDGWSRIFNTLFAGRGLTAGSSSVKESSRVNLLSLDLVSWSGSVKNCRTMTFYRATFPTGSEGFPEESISPVPCRNYAPSGPCLPLSPQS